MENESSDSSDSDSHPESEDCWAKSQREANCEGDWEFASNIRAFPVIRKKTKRAVSYTLREPLLYRQLKDLCRAAKEHDQSSFYFKNLLEATFSAHVLVPHNIKNTVHSLLMPAECMLWDRRWKIHLITLSDAYSKDANRPNFTVELAGEGNFQKSTDQAQLLSETTLQDLGITVKISLFLTPDNSLPTQNFANIKQGAKE